MGGGDLNLKKSWHPNTMKNQERVWKAEQAAALEQKRISELQQERTQENERSELNEMIKRSAGTSSDSRLNWMYDKPDKKAHSEDYLLGKSIEKNYGNEEKSEENAIPAVTRRVVGSSMIANSTETQQVDLARKMREDPLLLVKERERAARAALLNNPLHRRRIAELLRKEQEQKKKKTNKKEKKKDKDLDNMLAEKLSAFGDVKGMDISKLLASDDSSSDSDNSEANQTKKKKKHKKTKKKDKKLTKSKEKPKQSSENAKSSDEETQSSRKHTSERKPKHISENAKSSDEEKQSSRKHRSERRSVDKYESKKFETRKLKSSSCERDRRVKENKEKDTDTVYKKRRRYSSDVDERQERKNNRDDRYGHEYRAERVDNDRRYVDQKKKGSLSAEEKASRLAAMAAAGAQREVERGRRVAEQRRDADRPSTNIGPRTAREAHALPDSLESRIHSNRHYIQRGRHHMSENFAKR